MAIKKHEGLSENMQKGIFVTLVLIGFATTGLVIKHVTDQDRIKRIAFEQSFRAGDYTTPKYMRLTLEHRKKETAHAVLLGSWDKSLRLLCRVSRSREFDVKVLQDGKVFPAKESGNEGVIIDYCRHMMAIVTS